VLGPDTSATGVAFTGTENVKGEEGPKTSVAIEGGSGDTHIEGERKTNECHSEAKGRGGGPKTKHSSNHCIGGPRTLQNFLRGKGATFSYEGHKKQSKALPI